MVDPNRWGPAVWDAIHFVAAGYPVTPTDADVRAYGAFFRGLAGVLPCAPCRKHFAENIERLPPDAALAAGRAETFAWTVAFHNVVNESLHKPPLTLEAAHARYFEGRRSGMWSPATLGGLSVVVLVVLALAFVAIRRR